MTDLNKRREILRRFKELAYCAKKIVQKPKALIIGAVMASSMNANAAELMQGNRENLVESFGGYSFTRNEDGSTIVTNENGEQVRAEQLMIAQQKEFATYLDKDTLYFLDNVGNSFKLTQIKAFVNGSEFKNLSPEHELAGDVFRKITGDEIDKVFVFKSTAGNVRYAFYDTESQRLAVLKPNIKIMEAKKNGFHLLQEGLVKMAKKGVDGLKEGNFVSEVCYLSLGKDKVKFNPQSVQARSK